MERVPSISLRPWTRDRYVHFRSRLHIVLSLRAKDDKEERVSAPMSVFMPGWCAESTAGQVEGIKLLTTE
jgi:hypothetical protein